MILEIEKHYDFKGLSEYRIRITVIKFCVK